MHSRNNRQLHRNRTAAEAGIIIDQGNLLLSIVVWRSFFLLLLFLCFLMNRHSASSLFTKDK